MSVGVRTFVSVPVPNTSGFAPFIRDLSAIRNVRPSRETQMHITLNFLGDVPEDRIDDIGDIVSDAVSDVSRGRIAVKGTGVFPNPRSPRVIWAGVETEIPLAEISERIGRRLSAEGIPCDTKPFKPHITVARIDGKADISRPLRNYSSAEFASFICPAVLVMKSELTPAGPVHTILRMCELRRTPGS